MSYDDHDDLPPLGNRHPGLDRVRIWSGEHRQYWRPEAQGDTSVLSNAGIWTRRDAERLTKHCGPEKRIELRLVLDTIKPAVADPARLPLLERFTNQQLLDELVARGVVANPIVLGKDIAYAMLTVAEANSLHALERQDLQAVRLAKRYLESLPAHVPHHGVCAVGVGQACNCGLEELVALLKPNMRTTSDPGGAPHA